MNPLHVDTMVRVRDSYNETLIAIWEEGFFQKPIGLLTPFEAEKLRDALTRELQRPKAV